MKIAGRCPFVISSFHLHQHLTQMYKVVANPPPNSEHAVPCSPSHQSSLPKECQFGSANNAGNYGCMLDCKWACCHCRILAIARISTRHAVQQHLRPSIIGSALNCFFSPFSSLLFLPQGKTWKFKHFLPCFGSQGCSLSRVFPAIRIELTDYVPIHQSNQHHRLSYM